MRRFLDNLNNIWVLSKRNMIIFFKNPVTVFYSLLAPLLVFAVFVLFMNKAQIVTIKALVGDAQISDATISGLMNAWMVSGVVGIACVTIGFNSIRILVCDKEYKTINDFTASPIKPVNLLVSYFLSAVIVTFLIALFILFIVIIFLGASTGIWFSFTMILEFLLILLLSCLSSVMMMMFALSFFKSLSSTTAFTSVYTALIGFVTGAYFPLGSLPNAVQTIAGLIPGTHTINLFRNIFINNIAVNSGIVGSEFYNKLSSEYALKLNFFGLDLNVAAMYLYLTGSVILFFGLYLIADRIKARRKRRTKVKIKLQAADKKAK